MSKAPILLAGVLALSLTGCVAAAVGAVGTVGVSAAQDRTLGQAVDDATASGEIKTKLLRESGFREVDVEVADGLVLLSGRVNTPEHRVRAEDIAWSSNRVFDVANEINIERPGGFFAAVGDEVTTARVRRALIASPAVKSFNFNIETYDGVVYLMGIALTPEERVAAAEEASFVGGVRQVVSYVRVRDPAGRQTAAPSQDGHPPAYEDPDAAADQDLLSGNY